MQKFKVKIKGITPYIQHRMDDISLAEWEKKRGLIIERPETPKEDVIRAEYHSYKEGDNYYIPSDQIRGALIGSGGMSKSKVGNSRKSMKNIVAAMFFIPTEKISIPPYDMIDKRSAVNKNVKARVITVRPKWSNWEVEFDLHVDNDTISEESIREIIENAGNYIGIGSFRPTNNGQFGRFQLIDLTRV